MNLFECQRSNSRRKFIPIGGTKQKYSRRQRQYPLRLILWPFGRLFSCIRSRFDDATSPDKTALLSFEEQSCGDSESNVSAPYFSFIDRFPIWKEDINLDDGKSIQNNRGANHSIQESLTPKKSNRSQTTETRQTFKRLLSQKSDGKAHGRSDALSTDDGDSEHFSISTDFYNNTYWEPKVSSSKTFDSCVTPSWTTWDIECEQSRVTLQKFIESTVKDLTSMITPPINLADIAANDNASGGSALLAVSYDEIYPQLVLQTSRDGTVVSNRETGNNPSRLGATFAHPAAASRASEPVLAVEQEETRERPSKLGVAFAHPSVSSKVFDPSYLASKQMPCSTMWIEENIEKVWEQIDFDLANTGSFCEVSTISTSTRSREPLPNHWLMEDALEWSQSAGRIEKDVPMIDFYGESHTPQIPVVEGTSSRLRLVPHHKRHPSKRREQTCRLTEPVKHAVLK